MRNLASRLRTAVLAVLCVPAALGIGIAHAQPANYQGLWWNAPASSESGWGINFAHQGNTIFATWFTYDAQRQPWWLVAQLDKASATAFSGPIYTVTGPPFNSRPFPPTGSPGGAVETVVGWMTASFTDGTHGTISYTVNGLTQTKLIVPQEFGSLPICVYRPQPDHALASNYTDLWWSYQGTEAGWGINFTQHGGNLFATWFTYDGARKPWWLIADLQHDTANIFTGPVYTVTGPPFNSVPFPPAGSPGGAIESKVGTASVRFLDGSLAEFDYTVNGVTQFKNLTRQLFAPPAGTVCVASLRLVNSFDSSTEFWTSYGAGGFSWKSAGSEYAEPGYGAHLEGVDGGPQQPWYFVADRSNLGYDLSRFYGGELAYRFRWKADAVSDCKLRGKHDYYYQDWWKPDVAIYGRNGARIGYFFEYPPDDYWGGVGLVSYNVWREYRVPVKPQWGVSGDYRFGWIKDCNGTRPNCYAAATADEIFNVLRDVESLEIRGEYCLGSYDRGMLDEVVLKAHDTDGDGVPDLIDNCPNIINNQSDGDGDGIGDACDSN